MAQECPNPDPWQDAEDFGIDTSQLKSNRECSFEERALRHQQALDLVLGLKKAKEAHVQSGATHSSSPKI